MASRWNATQYADSAGLNHVNKVFMNGDKYTGGWKGAPGRPCGEGSYCWFDGSKYTGNWKEGKKAGLGTYYWPNWPNGGQYHGEWVNGEMHGVGTYEAADGTTYSGSWLRDMKHGLGRKVYRNGDVHEGLWKENRQHGPGRYRWGNRDEYDGEWCMGKMHGRGTLRWKSGDRYDGEFRDGLEEGVGIFTWRNGTTYLGFWKAGSKHGLGVYRPALNDHPRAASSSQDPSVRECPSEETGATVFPRASYEFERTAPLTADEYGRSENCIGHEVERPVPCHQRESIAGTQELLGVNPESSAQYVILLEYGDGKLLRQEMLTTEELEAVFGKDDDQKVWQRDLFKSTRAKRDLQGEHIYKGHRSYDLMLNLQLGIRFSVGRDFPEDLFERAIAPEHFTMQRAQFFPRDGSRDTPPHPTSDFSWKDYCPLAFRRLRGVFSIDRGDFVTSLCGDQALRELPSSGKSGSVFFLSHDGKYVIKTMRKGEIKLLLRLLPQYIEHVQQYPHTLLVKFYGVYRITPQNGRKVIFIVMNNLFQTNLPIHSMYDLKGSTQGRFSRPGPNVVLKDCNLDTRLVLESTWHEKLMHQLTVDCALLEALQVMDYSLLLGIHFKSAGSQPAASLASEKDEERQEEGSNADGNRPSFDLNVQTPKVMTTTSSHDENDVLRSDDATSMAETPSQARAYAARRREYYLKKRILEKLGCGHIDEQKMQDLLTLAQVRMLSRDPHKCTATRVLACRPSMTKKPESRQAPYLPRRMQQTRRHQGVYRFAHRIEATEELTQRLGGCRIQLGMSMQATCLPQPGKQCCTPEEGVCYFGIIDILQEYNYIKRFEHAAKSVRHGPNAISAVDPRTYSLRFKEFMRKLFG